MENQQFTPLVDDENNDNKSGSCMKSCLTVFLSMAGLFILVIISINIIDNIPRTIQLKNIILILLNYRQKVVRFFRLVLRTAELF